MSSILERLFRSACAVKRRATGSDDVVTINGKDYEDAMVEVITASEIFVAGGKAESGGFRVQLAKADFDTPPKKFDDISALGTALKILSIDNVNDVVYLLTAGDPLTQS